MSLLYLPSKAREPTFYDPSGRVREPRLMVPRQKPMGPVKIDTSRVKGWHKVWLAYGRIGNGRLLSSGVPTYDVGYNSTVVIAKGTSFGIAENIPNRAIPRNIYISYADVGSLPNGMIVAHTAIEGYSGAGGWISLRGDSGPDTLIYRSADNAINFRINTSTRALTLPASLFTDNVVHTLAIAWSGGNRRVASLDGKGIAIDTTAFTWSDAGAQRWVFGADPGGGGSAVPQDWLSIGVYAGYFSDAEVISAAADPYQFLVPA